MVIGKIVGVMDDYYEHLKEEMGIGNDEDEQKEEDSKLDEVIRVLRPNTTAKNFKDFLLNR